MKITAQQTRTSGNMSHTVTIELDSSEAVGDLHEYVIKHIDAHFASLGIQHDSLAGAADGSFVKDFYGGVLRSAVTSNGKKMAKWHGGQYEKFGIPLYSEHMPAQIYTAMIENNKAEHTLRASTVVKVLFEDGKPKKVVGFASE